MSRQGLKTRSIGKTKRLYKILYLKGRCYDRRVGLFLLSSPTFCFLFTLLEGLCFITRFRDRVVAGILVRRCFRQFILTISCCLSWNYKKEREIKSSVFTSFYNQVYICSFRFRSLRALSYLKFVKMLRGHVRCVNFTNFTNLYLVFGYFEFNLFSRLKFHPLNFQRVMTRFSLKKCFLNLYQ